MKKILGFIFFLIVIILIYLFTINKEKSYVVTYEIDEHKIKEEFIKEYNYYLFTIDDKVDYVIKQKYSNNRKLVNEINVEDNCYNIKVFNKNTENICINDENYLINPKTTSSNKKSEYENITIYNDKNVYVWNNYGLTNIVTKENYNFLTKETYENDLFYNGEKYVLFADYDQKRAFNKFYIFDKRKMKVSEFKMDINISFKSYFMGEIDDLFYIYDQENEVEYEINIKKEKVKKVSDNNGIKFYNLKWDMIDKTKYKYNEELFVKENVYNYEVINNELMFYFFKSNHNILIDKDVLEIISSNDAEVYYLKGNVLYCYNVDKNIIYKLVENFEWNFNYKNKIIV